MASNVALAATICVNPGGTSGCHSTIGAAVTAAAPGSVIRVAPGVYKEQVVIKKSLSLVSTARLGATIDATGLANGIFVDGMAAAPGVGVANVLISGFKVRNAKFEGVLVANANNVVLVDNLVEDNNRALDIATPACPGAPAFETNEGEDCGEGIHLIAVSDSSVVRNESTHNSGGILISDETGPSFEILVSQNYVHDNPYDCGITMASHGPATSVIPSAKLPYGISHNTISHNLSEHNGTQVPGAGAGVGIFAPFPGTQNSSNVVINNDLRNNGMPGFAMHNHASAPAPAPAVNMNNNVIVGNHFSGNAADTADTATAGPTGVNIFSTAPLYGTVVSENVFDNEAIDIAFKVPAGQLDAHFNDFSNSIGVDNLGSGSVNATEDWWHCATGPGAGPCATANGTHVVSAPFLSSAFAVE
jgi:hypothetical protein